MGFIGTTTVFEDGKAIFAVTGKNCCGQVVAFHTARGWFVASVDPFSPYDFQKIGKLDGNTISFKIDNRNYELKSDHPISSQTSKLDLWVVRIPPPFDKHEGNALSTATNFPFWLESNLTKQ